MDELPPLLNGVDSNMFDIDVTLETSQFPIFWLNAVAFWNMDAIFVTFDVLKNEISELKKVQPKKHPAKDVPGKK